MNLLRAPQCAVLLALALPARGQLPFQLSARPTGPYEIRGVVVDAKTSERLSGAELSIQESAQPSDPAFEIIQSNPNGNFRFANLAEGKYTLRASRQGYAQQALLQHENFWTGVAVGVGKDSLHVRFVLSPSATIKGQVTDENGEAVRGAAVTLWTEQVENGTRNMTGTGTAVTDDEGRYRFEHLLTGKYSVSVTATPWYSRYITPQQVAAESILRSNVQSSRGANATGVPVIRGASDSRGGETQTSLPDVVYPTLFYPNARDWHGMAWMNLEAGQVEGADFRLLPEPSARLQVKVSEGGNGQQPNVVLMMDLPGEGGDRAITPNVVSDSGVIEISGFAAGRYRVQTEGWRGNDAGLQQEIDISGSSQLRLEQAPPGGRPIRGEFRRADDEQKIEHAMLQLKDAKGLTYDTMYYGNAQGQASPAPNFRFENLPAGPQVFEFTVLQPADLVVNKIEAEGAKVTGTTIETDGSQEVNLLVTAVQTSSNLEGTALKQGKPFAGAMILLIPETRKGWDRLERRDQSDSDGTFRLPTILPGKYALLALENGWEIEWSKPEVLRPFLARAQKLEIGERPLNPVTVEVQ